MKAADHISKGEIAVAIAVITFWPSPDASPVTVMDWINSLIPFVALFLFLDGLQRFRSGISREIDEKTRKKDV